MKLHILCLDDNLQTLRQPLHSIFSTMLSGSSIPELSGGTSEPFKIKGFGEKKLEVEILSNSQNDPEKVIQEIERVFHQHMFDVVLVDDDWGKFGNTAGQSQLLPAAISAIKGFCPELPVFVLFTQHWDQTDRVKMFCDLMNQYPKEQRRVTGLHKNDTSGLMLLIQRVITEKRIAEDRQSLSEENERLASRIAHETALAHSSYSLLNHARHLIGFGPLLDLAERLEPFFQWRDHKYDHLPEDLQDLKPGFPSAFLFEGEPGSGKSTICKAIAEAFNSQVALPKDLGPGKHLGDWKALLKENVGQIYLQATDRKVVVVRADDLVWPSAAEMFDGAIKADWATYMNTLRECIEDAARINMGKKPEGSIARRLSQYNGKIIWLFARNRDEDVGSMYSPLRDKLIVYRASFPRDRDKRRTILDVRARQECVEFEQSALETALTVTKDYGGRDLIGDETSSKGFLHLAIMKAKGRALARFESGEKKPKATITADIIQEWLRSAECEEINRRINSTAGNPFGGATGIHPDGAAAPLYPDERLLGIAKHYLNDWERICRTYFPAKARISQEDIASKSGGLRRKDRVTRESISAAWKENGGVMLMCLDQSPSEFSTLLKKTWIRKWYHPDRVKILTKE